MHNAAKAYLSTQVNTVTPGKLLVMLYDGAIKYLNQAKDKIAVKDYAAKGILISKAIDVISELDESLNAQKGGQIAENLHSLYFYCNTRLLQANMNMDPKIIDEVLQILESIRAAFMEITSGLEHSSQQPAATPQAPTPPPAPQAQGAPAHGGDLGQPVEPNRQPPAPGPKPGKFPGTYGRMGGYK